MIWSRHDVIYVVVVGDITIGYLPPRRGRVIPLAVHNKKTQEDAEDGSS